MEDRHVVLHDLNAVFDEQEPKVRLYDVGHTCWSCAVIFAYFFRTKCFMRSSRVISKFKFQISFSPTESARSKCHFVTKTRRRKNTSGRYTTFFFSHIIRILIAEFGRRATLF